MLRELPWAFLRYLAAHDSWLWTTRFEHSSIKLSILLKTNTGLEYGIKSHNIVNFDPMTGNVLRYGHVEDFEKVIKRDHARIAAVMMEPIHGGLE